MEGPEIQLNITNLLDEEYVSTLGANGFNACPDNQTLTVGSTAASLRHGPQVLLACPGRKADTGVAGACPSGGAFLLWGRQ